MEQPTSDSWNVGRLTLLCHRSGLELCGVPAIPATFGPVTHHPTIVQTSKGRRMVPKSPEGGKPFFLLPKKPILSRF
jgi:hypothetical protein